MRVEEFLELGLGSGSTPGPDHMLSSEGLDAARAEVPAEGGDAAATSQATWPPANDEGQWERAQLDTYVRVQERRMRRNPKNPKQWQHGWECKEDGCKNLFTIASRPTRRANSRATCSGCTTTRTCGSARR